MCDEDDIFLGFVITKTKRTESEKDDCEEDEFSIKAGMFDRS